LGLQPANLGGVSTMTGTSPSYQNTGSNILGGAMAGNALFAGNPYAMAGGALLGLL